MANIIAIIWDCDKTLVDGYMQDPIFEEYQINPSEFWTKVNAQPAELAKQGIRVNRDTYYLNYFIQCAHNGTLSTTERISLFMRWLIMHGGSFRQHAKYATPFTNCLPPTAEIWRSELSALQSFLISASPCWPNTARIAGGIGRAYAYP